LREDSPLLRYVLTRLLWAIPTALGSVLLVFAALRSLPNNPAIGMFGQHAVPEQIVRAMSQHGWDRPLPEQMLVFLRQLLWHGDLGRSFFTGESVSAELFRRVPATLELAGLALLIAFPLGVLAGVTAAVFRGRWPDHLCMTGALLGVSVPIFFLGICLLGILTQMPTGRRLPIGMDFPRTSEFIFLESLIQGRLDISRLALWHLCLPALALSTIPLAFFARVTRNALLEVLHADYIRTARAMGHSWLRVIWRQALPNAMIPLVSIAGLQVGTLLSGAVLTETVFSWPGLGRYLVEGIQRSDYNVVQGSTLVIAVSFVLVNLIVDVLQAWLDPRVRLGDAAGE